MCRAIAKPLPAPPAPNHRRARGRRRANARMRAETESTPAGPCGMPLRYLPYAPLAPCPRRLARDRPGGRRSRVTSRGLILLALVRVDLAQELEKIFRHRLLHDVVVHAAQLPSDGTLTRARGDGLLFVRLFLFHIQCPALASCSRPVPESSVHATSPMYLILRPTPSPDSRRRLSPGPENGQSSQKFPPAGNIPQARPFWHCVRGISHDHHRSLSPPSAVSAPLCPGPNRVSIKR